MLTQDTIAKILLTTQDFLVASLPSLPRLCCYDLTHKTSVSIAAPIRFEGLGKISNLKMKIVSLLLKN